MDGTAWMTAASACAEPDRARVAVRTLLADIREGRQASVEDAPGYHWDDGADDDAPPPEPVGITDEMYHDAAAFRGYASESLLRLYDQVRRTLATQRASHERDRSRRLLDKVTQVLWRRGVRA